MSQNSRRDDAAPLLAQAHAHADGKHDEKNQDNVVPDAGLRSLDHYKRALPRWRYSLRQRMLPLVRWETPYLAYLQNKVRTPALDTYFAVTANLGTHTFFMVGLPIFIWCGWPTLTRTMVHLLAGGVFFTGFIKDMCSLPRPLSPPLQRITMSGSAALEYGFPSTHSANAVSVAVYAILSLRGDHSSSEPHALGDNAQFALEALAYLYALSIVVGRLYCGMHGFVDVVAGSLFGALISLAEYYYGPSLADYMQVSGWTAPALVALIIITLVRVHPEPADDCPCFDDSVAFAGVVIGIEIGTRRLLRSASLGSLYVGGALDLGALGLPATLARIALGVVVIFAWREIMKPALLKFLPHLFRVIERAGMSLPRRFFMPASEYKKIPPRLRVDNVMPSVSDLPRLVRSFRQSGRGRSASVSVGPQSAADAYETLAYRERRRRESIGSNASVKSAGSLFDLKEGSGGGAAAAVVDGDVNAHANAAAGGQDRTGAGAQASGVNASYNHHQHHHQQQHDSLQEAVAKYEEMMGQVPAQDASEAERATSPDDESALEGEGKEAVATAGAAPGDELGEKEIFSKLVKPRVRYDVEVVTKLIVYAGIGWLSAEFMPNLFELVGLGVSHLAVA